MDPSCRRMIRKGIWESGGERCWHALRLPSPPVNLPHLLLISSPCEESRGHTTFPADGSNRRCLSEPHQRPVRQCGWSWGNLDGRRGPNELLWWCIQEGVVCWDCITHSWVCLSKRCGMFPVDQSYAEESGLGYSCVLLTWAPSRYKVTLIERGWIHTKDWARTEQGIASEYLCYRHTHGGKMNYRKQEPSKGQVHEIAA